MPKKNDPEGVQGHSSKPGAQNAEPKPQPQPQPQPLDDEDGDICSPRQETSTEDDTPLA